MTLPVKDSLVIGGALAASAVAILALTAPARSPAPVAPEPTAQVATPPEDTAAAPLVAEVAGDEAPPDVDPEFGAQVRAYLLENPEVIFEAVAEFERRNAMNQADADVELIFANAEELFDSPDDWVGGNPDGDITLVEFLDYRCGFCRQAHDELELLLAEDDNIRFVIKEFPILGPDSEASSRFAIAMLQLEGSDAYKAAHDALIKLEGRPDDAALAAIADDIGVDFDAIRAQMGAVEVSQVIEDNRLLAQRLQISGTPTFIMETEMVRGFVPADALLGLAEELRGG